jgi:hypothetical protein
MTSLPPAVPVESRTMWWAHNKFTHVGVGPGWWRGSVLMRQYPDGVHVDPLGGRWVVGDGSKQLKTLAFTATYFLDPSRMPAGMGNAYFTATPRVLFNGDMGALTAGGGWQWNKDEAVCTLQLSQQYALGGTPGVPNPIGNYGEIVGARWGTNGQRRALPPMLGFQPLVQPYDNSKTLYIFLAVIFTIDLIGIAQVGFSPWEAITVPPFLSIPQSPRPFAITIPQWDVRITEQVPASGRIPPIPPA